MTHALIKTTLFQIPQMSLTPIRVTELETAPTVTPTEQIISLWLHGKSKNTSALYRRVSSMLFAASTKPIQWLSLQDFQSFADSLEERGLAISSRRTYISVIKSLMSFSHRAGLIPVNASVALSTPKSKDALSQKILTESDILILIAKESNPRNKLLLKVLYYAGLRVSELCGLNWSDLSANGDSGQLLIFGKGGKTRVVLLPKVLYHQLLDSRGDTSDSDPIFRSRKSNNDGRLHRATATRLVKDAAINAGLSEKASAHWLRHCHASHSLNRGAPIHLLAATLGHSSIATTTKYLHAKPNDSSALYLAG